MDKFDLIFKIHIHIHLFSIQRSTKVEKELVIK
jgi:hypothetical protein